MSKSRLAAGTAAANAVASSAPPGIEPGGARGITTVPGQVAALLPGFVEAKDALVKAKEALAKWDGAMAVRKLDPIMVRRSKWANRSEAEFKTPEFAALKDEIANAGGNVQPIQVRSAKPGKMPNDGGVVPNNTPTGEGVVRNNIPAESYEIAYGHRRHQACLELGLPVLCQIVDGMNDRELFEVMDRENRSRKNLSAYDQGRMYVQAIDSGLYPSLRKLAEALGVDLGNASKYTQLARLPMQVVEAFKSPLDMAQRWAKPLTDAVSGDESGVLARAKTVRSERGDLDANAIFEILIGKVAAEPKVTPIEIGGKNIAFVKVGQRGRATVEFEAGALTSLKQAGLANLIRDYLSHP